jgi:hypothetical protein
VNLAEPVIVERIRVELAGEVPPAESDPPEPKSGPVTGPDTLNDGKNTENSPGGEQMGTTN